MAQELKSKFIAAEKLVNENRVQVPESLKMKLYGLAKHAKEGDCKMPQPPTSNAILRAKWDSWTACAGTPIEVAMKDFIELVDKLEPNAKNAIADNIQLTNKRAAENLTSSRKQGILYKRRDVMKGWRPRHFVLQDGILQYYIDAVDTTPRGTIDLGGSSVSTDKPVNVDGIDYFPFIISKGKQQYYLSSDNKLDADIWVAKIIEAASTATVRPSEMGDTMSTMNEIPASVPVSTPASSSSTGSSSSSMILPSILSSKSSRNAAPAVEVPVLPSCYMTNVSNAAETRAFTPKDIMEKIEKGVKSLIDELSGDASDWEVLYEKTNYTAKKKPHNQVVIVKVESVVPYSLWDIFKVLLDCKRQQELDGAKQVHDMLKSISNHTWIEYVRFKAIWPTSARDFVNIAHWRLLQDGSVVIVAFGESAFDHLKPVEEGNVRGQIYPSGYLLQSTDKGTLVKYIVNTDLKGSLPSTVIKFACYAQADAVNRLKGVLDGDKKKATIKHPLNYISNYSELAMTFSDLSYDVVKDRDTNVQSVATTTTTTAPPTSTTSGASVVSTTSTATTNPVVTTSVAPSASSASSSKSLGPNASLPRRATMLKHASKLSNVNAISLLVLFLPPLLYFLIDKREYRVIAFLGSLLVVVNYLIRIHLGKPELKTSEQIMNKVADGHFTFRFPVELGRLLVYIDHKRSESTLEVTFTHVVVKACAMAIAEIPSLNGHVVMNQFYRSKTKGVDMSVFVDVNERSTAAVKIEDADAKPTEYIADEIIGKVTDLRSDVLIGSGTSSSSAPKTLRQKLRDLIPSFILNFINQSLHDLGNQYGVGVSALGIVAYPYGVCTVITSPDAESDIDLSFTSKVSSAPIVVTMGGLRIIPTLDTDRKVNGAPVLNFGVIFNNQATSLTEARQFLSRLQQLLNDPNLLDKLHQKALFDREEALKRKQFFG